MMCILHLMLDLIADPSEAGGCSTNSLVINSIIHSAFSSHSFTAPPRSSSYKINYIIVITNFLKPEGYQNPINGLKVAAILLKGWILPSGGVSAVEGLQSTGLPPLVFTQTQKHEERELFFYSSSTSIIPLM